MWKWFVKINSKYKVINPRVKGIKTWISTSKKIFTTKNLHWVYFQNRLLYRELNLLENQLAKFELKRTSFAWSNTPKLPKKYIICLIFLWKFSTQERFLQNSLREHFWSHSDPNNPKFLSAQNFQTSNPSEISQILNLRLISLNLRPCEITITEFELNFQTPITSRTLNKIFFKMIVSKSRSSPCLKNK